jgi:hypothetical protein
VEFKKAIDLASKTSIRHNSAKPIEIDREKSSMLWFDQGYYLKERSSFTLSTGIPLRSKVYLTVVRIGSCPA